MVWIIVIGVGIMSTGLLGYWKLRFARLALKDVPVEKRVDVLNAIGGVFEKWRWR